MFGLYGVGQQRAVRGLALFDHFQKLQNEPPKTSLRTRQRRRSRLHPRAPHAPACRPVPAATPQTATTPAAMPNDTGHLARTRSRPPQPPTQRPRKIVRGAATGKVWCPLCRTAPGCRARSSPETRLWRRRIPGFTPPNCPERLAQAMPGQRVRSHYPASQDRHPSVRSGQSHTP